MFFALGAIQGSITAGLVGFLPSCWSSILYALGQASRVVAYVPPNGTIDYVQYFMLTAFTTYEVYNAWEYCSGNTPNLFEYDFVIDFLKGANNIYRAFDLMEDPDCEYCYWTGEAIAASAFNFLFGVIGLFE